MPDTVRAYSGSLPLRDASEAVADENLSVIENAPRPSEGQFTGGSPYRSAFRQGATLVPRMLCMVERKAVGRLGGDPTAPFVASRRNNQEKAPWKILSSIEHRVESEFLHPVLLGECISPYRILQAFEGVVPVTAAGAILDAQAAANRGVSGLHGWMSEAERVWNTHRASTMSLIEQFDYYGKLSAQFPLSALRVIYAASGTIPAACLLRDSLGVIEHGIYWASVATEQEGHYLTAIFNSETARSRVATLQARGQWGARHFDKVVFTLPIPRFDNTIPLHSQLAEAARKAESFAATVTIPPSVKFQRARKIIRDALVDAEIAPRIEELVASVLGG
jgi:hypothetical protein